MSELSHKLDEITRLSPQSSDPRVRGILAGLVPQTRELLRTQSASANGFFLSVGRSLSRLRGQANADLRLELLTNCCRHLYFTGTTIDAIALAESGVALASRAARKSHLRRLLSLLGAAVADLGDRGRGIELLVRALGISHELADWRGQYACWSNLSVILIDSGLYREAVSCAARAVELINSSDPDAQDYSARTLTNTALALLLLGEAEQANDYAMKAVEISEEPSSLESATARLVRELNYVLALVATGRLAHARERTSYMRTLTSRYPSPRSELTTRLCEGFVEVYVGDAARGVAQLEKLCSEVRGVMVPLYVDCLSTLVSVYSDVERPEDALRALKDLLDHLEAVKTTNTVDQLRSLGIDSASISFLGRRNSSGHELHCADLRVRIAEREVLRSRQEMLERIAVAADIREDISGEHGYRVGRLSAFLAMEIGWDRDACNAIDIAARLHDIGKIGIPEKILLDERTLKKAEKHFIASHTTIGAEILSKSDIPQVRIAEEIARCHHEWWDGTGYPRQLNGMEIPKSARIVALADAFDAMTHGRPYAVAMSIEESLSQIANLRGRQFDPELTDHFLSLVRRLAAENPDLDAHLSTAARNSPFLKARARIKEMLAQGRDSTALSVRVPPPGSPLN